MNYNQAHPVVIEALFARLDRIIEGMGLEPIDRLPMEQIAADMLAFTIYDHESMEDIKKKYDPTSSKQGISLPILTKKR